MGSLDESCYPVRGRHVAVAVTSEGEYDDDDGEMCWYPRQDLKNERPTST